MLRHLKELIVDLNLNEEKYSDYALVATCFRKYDVSKQDFVKIEMPKNEKEFNACEKIDNPIFEILIDKNDPEICFITEYLPENKDALSTPVICSDFLTEISSLPEKYLEYEILSSAWKYLDEEYNLRVDIPIVAVLVDEENHRVCLIETAKK